MRQHKAKNTEKVIVQVNFNILPENESNEEFNDFDKDFCNIIIAFLVSQKHVILPNKNSKVYNLPRWKDSAISKLDKIWHQQDIEEIFDSKGMLKLLKLNKWLNQFRKQLEKDFCIDNEIDILNVRLSLETDHYSDMRKTWQLMNDLEGPELREMLALLESEIEKSDQ